MLSVAAAAALACGCSRVGIGTRVNDLGDGRYRIATSQASDVAALNDRTALEACPAGYAILHKGVEAEGMYGSPVKGADLATFWIIRRKAGK